MAARASRRLDWFLNNLTPGKALNMQRAATAFLARRETAGGWPVFLRIDISPLCNLQCTICVHADPHSHPDLEKQCFQREQKMSVEQFRCIIDQCRDRSTGVSLYHLGDPLVHPDVNEMCAIAHDAGLNVHYSTNFSFSFSNAAIRELVTSGLTHLTVCVDGLSQEKYQLTRVGGRIDRVMSNLERVCAYRRESRQRLPKIEVQYIRYQHNLEELDQAKRIFTAMGIDQVHAIWGGLHNYTDRDPGHFTVFGPKAASFVPQCHWPHFFMVILYDGDVLPCCAYRLGQLYTRRPDRRAMGNVFQTGVRSVWAADEYRRTRRLVCHPDAIGANPSLADNFCYGCPRLFDTDYETATCRWGKDWRFEDLYTLGENGRPIRRRPTVQTPDAKSATTPG